MSIIIVHNNEMTQLMTMTVVGLDPFLLGVTSLRDFLGIINLAIRLRKRYHLMMVLDR